MKLSKHCEITAINHWRFPLDMYLFNVGWELNDCYQEFTVTVFGLGAFITRWADRSTT